MNEKLIEEFNDNVLEFKKPLLKLMPKEPGDGDWLSDLPVGTEFKCRDKTGRNPSWLVHDFTYLGKLKGDVYLSPTVSLQDSKTWFWVDPGKFCREWEFRGVIEYPQNQIDETTDADE